MAAVPSPKRPDRPGTKVPTDGCGLAEVPIYTGKTETIETLARSLIVASAVHSDALPIQLSFSTHEARALGRYLESSFTVLRHWDQVRDERTRVEAMAEQAAATMSDANDKLDRSLATLGEARVQSVTAEAALARAIKINRTSMLWFLGCIAILAVNVGVLWWGGA